MNSSSKLAEIERVLLQSIKGQLDARASISPDGDQLDAIATGLNVLLDEFTAMVITDATKPGSEALSHDPEEQSHEYETTNHEQPIGEWSWNIKTGELKWSDTAYVLFGYEAQSFTPEFEDYIQHLHPESRPHVEHLLKVAIEDDVPYKSVQRIVRANGVERLLYVRGSLRRDASGDALELSGTARDITELERAKGVLTQDFGEALVRMAKNPTIFEGKLSQACHAITEAVAKELNVERCGIWLYSEDRQSIRCLDCYTQSADTHTEGTELLAGDFPAYFEAMATERTIAAHDAHTDPRTREFSEPYLTPLGITSLLDTPIRRGGKMVGVICNEHIGPGRHWNKAEQNFGGSVGDFVAYALEASELRLSQQHLATAQAMANLGSWEWDLTTSTVRWTDEVFRIYGHAPNAMEPEFDLLMDQVHPEDRDRLSKAIQATLEGGSPYRVKHRIIRPNGEERTLECTGYGEQNEEGEIVNMYGTCHDISEREIAQKATEEKEAAEAANRAKTDFLAVMSHELRTPLNGILGMADVLDDTPLNAAQRANLDGIRRASRRLERLVADVLDFAKMESGELRLEITPFSPRQLVREAVDNFTTDAGEKGITISLDVDDSIPQWVNGDPTRLEQVLANLLGNAIKFSNAGTINITIQRNDDDQLRFSVQDRGVGIAESDQHRVFQRFERVTHDHSTIVPGSGLGLAICKQVVELMGGEIMLQSAAGAGTTISFVLPLTTVGEPTREETNSTTTPNHIDGKGKYVLLVEDDILSREVERILLEKEGFSVVCAGNGAEAVEHARNAKFDLILMDCRLPVMDGYLATQNIRAQESGESHTPIIALTAHALDSDKTKALEAGMDNYLTKPITRERLHQILPAYLR